MIPSPELSRRQVLNTGMGLAAALALAGTPLAAFAQTVSQQDLLASPPLPDIWLGNEKAPVTIIEYASMTCSHCAAFHKNTYPAFKAKYIDTGKVRYTLREFPLDPLAAAAFMLARCTPGGTEKRAGLIDVLFDQQRTWAFTDKPLQALTEITRQAGFSQETFESCLKNQELYDGVTKTRDLASQKFGVTSTPTFFINGRKQTGDISIEALDKLLEPLLKS
jgi:protein-disulfide isomerase